MNEKIKEEKEEQPTRTFVNIGELIKPLKRPDDESFEDYKIRRMTANAMIKFYLRRHFWPKVEA